MKTLEQIGLKTITYKLRTNELTEQLRKINEKLYRYNRRYINYSIAKDIAELIESVGKEVKDYYPKTGVGATKKADLLFTLRKYYKLIDTYKTKLDEEDYHECAKRTYSYVTSQYIRTKKQLEDNKDKIIELLDICKEVKRDWNLSTIPSSFLKMEDELFELLKDYYFVPFQRES